MRQAHGFRLLQADGLVNLEAGVITHWNDRTTDILYCGYPLFLLYVTLSSLRDIAIYISIWRICGLCLGRQRMSITRIRRSSAVRF